MTAAPERKWTESALLDLLRKRHAGRGGNGPEWAYLEHVRDAAGFDATRTIDALALHLWPSRGHEMHAFEVKVSRSDWRRELANPAKADGWCRLVDRFWIVAPRGVVPHEEVPASWGLLETRGTTGLVATVPAPLLCTKAARPLIGRGLLACMLRAAGAGLASTPDEEALKAAEERGREQGRQSAENEIASLRRTQEEWADLARRSRDAIGELEQALGGISLQAWRTDQGERARQVAEALRAVLAGDEAVAESRRKLERAASDLEHAASYLRTHAGKHR